MQFNIIFKTIFEYIHNKFCFVHTNTFCKYRKKLRASPRVHLVSSFFVTEKKLPYVVTRDVCPSVRPSSVEITLERGFDRSAEPIYLKIGFKYGKFGNSCLKGAISRNSICKLQIYATYDYLQINLCARF